MESLKSHLSLFVNGDNEQPEGKKQENSQPDTKISEESNGADQVWQSTSSHHDVICHSYITVTKDWFHLR